jgi:hypothetical protein
MKDKANEPLKQVGYQPVVRVNSERGKSVIMPYFSEGLFNLYEELKKVIVKK